jgi:hypothetical protein
MMIIDALEVSINALIVTLNDCDELIGCPKSVSFLHQCLIYQLPLFNKHSKGCLGLIQEGENFIIVTLCQIDLDIELHKVLWQGCTGHLSLSGLFLLFKVTNG